MTDPPASTRPPGPANPPNPGPATSGLSSRRRRTLLIGLALVVVLLVGALVLVPDRAPALKHSSVLNALFDSRAVIGGTRLVALVGALYLLLSIVVRIEQDQWLKHVGPADVAGRQIEDVADDREELRNQLGDANATIHSLRQQLAAVDAAYRALAAGDGEADTGPGR